MRWMMALAALAISTGAASLAAGPASYPTEGDPIPRVVATDPTYGLTPTNPIRVGGTTRGLVSGETYLGALRGPSGERLDFVRRNACCAFRTLNAWFGDEALLEAYQVRYPGRRKPVILYLNLYEWEEPKAPVGFTLEGGDLRVRR